MEEKLFENNHVMNFKEAISLIKSYFKENFPKFQISQEYNESTGYWGVRYSYPSNEIFLSSDRGCLEHEIILNCQSIQLLQIDPLMSNVKAASQKNIIYILKLLKTLIKERNV